MLVTPYGTNFKRSVELSAAQAQAMVDLEAMCAGMGLVFDLLCINCRKARDAYFCSGDAVQTDDGGMSFSISCHCTERTYTGHGVTPPRNPQTPSMKPRKDPNTKTKKELTRRQMGIIWEAESVMKGLELQYGLRCLRCRVTGEESDGCFGVTKGESSQFVCECACSVRTYTGWTAAASIQ